MALIKKRPELRLLAPPQVRPGETFVAEVIVRARRPVPTSSLDVHFVGEERVTIGSGKHSRTARKTWVTLHARLSKARRMVGEQRFRVRFAVPPTVPTSYSGCQARVQYLVKIHAAIPWWPDARASFVIPVVPPPADAPARPFVFSSNPSGPTAGEPHVEASLTNTVLRPGGVVEGAVALSNVDTSRYYGVQVHLRGRQTSVVRGSKRSSWCFGYTLTVPLARAVEGQPLPFALRIPNIFPTCRGAHYSLAWAVEVCAQRRFARDTVIRAPVTVLPRDAQREARPRKRVLPPTVGSPRVAAIWKRVAADVGLRLRGDTLVGNIGPTELCIARDVRGSAGNYLLGTLSFPNLHLGLDGGPLGGFSRYLSLAQRVLWPDKHHYFIGRDLAQVRAFASALLPRNFPHELADASDECVIIQQKGAGQTHTELLRFARNMRLVAHNFPKALARVPAPKEFSRTAVASWRKLAAKLAGGLELTHMAVCGSYDGRRASVRTVWSGPGPQYTEILIEPLQPIPENHLMIRNAEDPQMTRNLRRGVREQLQAATAGALGYAIKKRSVSVTISAPLRDHRAALAALEGLVNLELALLRRSAYR